MVEKEESLSNIQRRPRMAKRRASSSRRAGTTDKAEGSIWNLAASPHAAWPVAWNTRKRSDAKTVFIIHALWTGAHARTRKNQFLFLPAFTRFVRTAESCPLGFSLDSHGLREFNWILPASYIFLHFSLPLFLYLSFSFVFACLVYLFFHNFATISKSIEEFKVWGFHIRFFFFFEKN